MELLQLLQIIIKMGAANNGPSCVMEIKVATLNYSGILKSPYEFYENEEAERKLSENTKKIFEQYKNRFAFQFGPFDREWQQGRFSPLYLPSCGIKNSVHMMNQRQFDDEWESCKASCKEKLNKIYEAERKKKRETNPLSDLKEMDFYLQNLKMFDFLIYKALLEDIYCEGEEREELKNNFEKNQEKFQLSSKAYKINRRKRFTKPFLNENEKIRLTLSAITALDLDILFLQEADQAFVQAVEQRPKQFRIVKSFLQGTQKLNSQSIIVIRLREPNQKFPKFTSLMVQNNRLTNNIAWIQNPNVKNEELSAADLKKLNFNSDTVVQLLYNIILISPHLSSKADKNQLQVKDLREQFAFLKEKFPDCHIILGGDLNNSTIENFKTERGGVTNVFNVVPDCLNHFTAHKMRTDLQAQPSKANKKIDQVKDYIISDLPVKQAYVQTIQGTRMFNCSHPFEIAKDLKHEKMPLLPSETHPYDHYMVIATLMLEDKLEHVTDPQYKLKFQPKLLTEQEQGYINQYEKTNNERREKQRTRMEKQIKLFNEWEVKRKAEKEKKQSEKKK